MVIFWERVKLCRSKVIKQIKENRIVVCWKWIWNPVNKSLNQYATPNWHTPWSVVIVKNRREIVVSKKLWGLLYMCPWLYRNAWKQQSFFGTFDVVWCSPTVYLFITWICSSNQFGATDPGGGLDKNGFAYMIDTGKYLQVVKGFLI